EIGRVVLDTTLDPIPLISAPGEKELVFESVRITPQPGSTRFLRLELVYRPQAAEIARLHVSGRIDLQEERLTLNARAQNLDLAKAPPIGLPEGLLGLISRLRPDGPVDLTLTVNLPWRRPEELTLEGTAECYALSVHPLELPRPLTNLRGRVRFAGDTLTIEGLSGVWSTAEVLLRGTVQRVASTDDVGASPEARIDLNVTAWNIPLEELNPLDLPGVHAPLRALRVRGRAAAHARIGSARSPVDGRLNARLQRLDLQAENLVLAGAALESATSAITLEKRASAAAGAPVKGRISLEGAIVLGVPIARAAATVRNEGRTLALEGLDLVLAPGHLTGTAVLNLPDPAIAPSTPGTPSSASVTRLELEGELGFDTLLQVASGRAVTTANAAPAPNPRERLIDLELDLNRAGANGPLVGTVRLGRESIAARNVPVLRDIEQWWTASGNLPFADGLLEIKVTAPTPSSTSLRPTATFTFATRTARVTGRIDFSPSAGSLEGTARLTPQTGSPQDLKLSGTLAEPKVAAR
ncbi:MAG: hypothetical protein ACYTFT_14600, partial [Planctomycetota bacterium]